MVAIVASVASLCTPTWVHATDRGKALAEHLPLAAKTTCWDGSESFLRNLPFGGRSTWLSIDPHAKTLRIDGASLNLGVQIAYRPLPYHPTHGSAGIEMNARAATGPCQSASTLLGASLSYPGLDPALAAEP